MPSRGGYAPTDGLAYDPEDPSYWDEAALHRETARVFDVCAGCRMCFKYCDAFPKLFATADGAHDGDARALTSSETAAVSRPVSARASPSCSRSAIANSFGKVSQYLKHMRQPAQTSNTRAVSRCSAASSQ